MMRRFLALALLPLGLATGIGMGYVMRLPHLPVVGREVAQPPEYIKMNNQFVIPVVEGGRVTSMVVMSLSFEMAPDNGDLFFQREPKLRDALLQVLFNHANAGGFKGTFTEAANLLPLRKALTEQAAAVMGSIISDVLITEIARQDH